MYKKLLCLLLGSFLLFGCQKKDTNESASLDKDGVTVQVNQSLKVCKSGTVDCVESFQVLSDLYNQPGFDSIGNIGLVPNQGVVSIVAAIKLNDGKDDFAVFLTQATVIDGGTLSTCHACPALLGLAVYQYHNQWKLYASDFKVGRLGAWGRVMGYSDNPKDVSVVPISNENFLLTIKNSDGGQGYTSDYLTFVEVSPTGINRYGNPIKMLGTIETAASDCGSGATTGNDWKSEVVINAKQKPLSVLVKKRFKKNCTEDVVSGDPIEIKYTYDGKGFSIDRK